MRRLASLGLLLVIPAVSACTERSRLTAPQASAPAASMGISAAEPLSVMTQNMYLGANLDILLDPTIPSDQALAMVLGQLMHTDYPDRALHMAQEIAARQPAAVGLQEVSTYVFDTEQGVNTMAFLDILQAYLSAMGASYDVAVYNPLLTLTIPINAGGINAVTYTDGDAILVRSDLSWSDPFAADFAAAATLPLPTGDVSNTHGWMAVTVEDNGVTFRFVNTHLEVQLFRDVQEAQARQLAAALQGDTLPIVLVGDFNSAANPSAPEESKTDSYHILRQAGFADLELRQPHSADLLTCCQAPDLGNAVTSFDQRLDLVLARFGAAGFGGQGASEVVGASSSDRFSVTVNSETYDLWPSDHAGIFAKIWPAPGIRGR